MRPHSLSFNVLSVSVIVAITPASTRGAAIQVTSDVDPGTGATCTFRQAVASINLESVAGTGCTSSGAFGTSDTITFAPSVTGISLGDLPNNSVIISTAHDLSIQGNAIGGVSITRPTAAINKFGILRSTNSNCSLSLSGLSLSNGYALSTSGGGGLYAAGAVVATNSIITANTARAPGTGTTHGGGIVASSVTLTSSEVSGNQQLGYGTGGGVFANTVTLTGSSVTGNSAVGIGGGIDATSSVSATQSVISGNSALGGGGIVSPVITVEYSTVADNEVSGYGGGLSGVVTVSNSTVSGNSATGGGGISAYTAHITNSTISSNAAVNYGGGMFASKVFLLNSTVTANTISQGQSAGIAVGYTESVPSVSLISSIISQNDTSSGKIDFASHKSLVATGDHNLVGTTLNIGASLTNSVSGNPLLGPLANNGGATLTHALSPSSPAIDAGANPQDLATDQRGMSFARESGGLVDIGAFQLQDEIFKNGFE